MPKMYLIFIILLAVIPRSYAREPDPYVIRLQNNKKINLPDGKELVLVRLFDENGPNMHMRLFLRQGQKILWDVTYKDEHGTLWADAHFLPLFDKTFVKDLNSDGSPEFAVQTWHGGNAMHLCRAIIFTVKEDKLIPIKTRQSNYEFARMVYSNEQEALRSLSP
jgi:hypothetical protein